MMHRIAILLLLVMLFPLSLRAQFRGAFSSAGDEGSSATYTIQFTVGESIQGVDASSSTYQLSTGFYLPQAGVDLSPPALNVLGLPFSIQENTALTIQTDANDSGSGLESVTLSFRQGGETTFTDIPMALVSGDTYSATVTQENITSRGGEVIITARDNNGNVARRPTAQSTVASIPVLVEIEAPGLESPLRQGQQQSDYRLISSPLNLDSKSSATVLADLGAYDDTRWRFWSLKNNYFDFEGEAQFTELRSGASFDPGAAFFLLSADGGFMRTGDAVTISTAAPFTKSLHRGWNFIGNPFNFNIPASAVSLSNGMTPDIRSFSGGWSAANSLQPFQGYIIDAGLEVDNVTLTIDPDLSAGTVSSKHQDAGALHAGLSWSVSIDARSGELFDTYNLIGASNTASDAWDVLDRPEPPIFDDFISVYFPHEEWGLIHKRFQSDIRPESSAGDVWNLEVAAGTRAPITLTFSGLDEVPSRYDIHLVDHQAGIAQDLRVRSTYVVVPAGNGRAWPLQVVVGEAAFVEERIETPDFSPATLELDQNYPNPFNPTTSIRYGIARDAVVTLKIYDLLGKVVATLVDQEFKTAGYHLVHWDARTDDATEAASGVYVYRLSVAPGTFDGPPVGNTTLARKMLLVK